MPTHRLWQFKIDIALARDLVVLGQDIAGVARAPIDSTYMFRFAIVQVVAALDAYVHGAFLDRAVDLLTGRLTAPFARSSIGLSFAAVHEIVTASTRADMELAARRHLARRLATETFQRPVAIAAALATVGISSVWKTAFPGAAKETMAAVNAIVDRRNSIVHGCDRDPLSDRWPMPLRDTEVLHAIETIDHVVTKIDSLC